jgi:hypothetical protein
LTIPLFPGDIQLLLRIKQTELSIFSLLPVTELAVIFNHRHDRTGHLYRAPDFQTFSPILSGCRANSASTILAHFPLHH